ncbi:RHS repeat domain-containing protein [Arthrobacter sp. D3-16]
MTEGIEYLIGDKVIAAGTYPGSGSVTVTARAKGDYVLSVGAVAEWSHAFEATPFQVGPAAVVFSDKDGTADDTYTVPTTEGVEYLVDDKVIAAGIYPGLATVTVKARATTDYALVAGAVAEWSHGFKATPYQVTPAAAVFTDKDGTAEDRFIVPVTEGVEYLVDDKVIAAGIYPGLGTVTVKARAKTDYVLVAGAVAEWSNAFEATPYQVTPAAVVFTDKDGTAEDTFTVPVTEGVEYLVDDKVIAAGIHPGLGPVAVKARAITDYVLAAGAAAEWPYAFKATPYKVTPAAVVFNDNDGTAEDTFTVQATQGVDYLVGDKVTSAGTYPAAGTVTVRARAITDYVLAAGSAAEWSHAFKATPYKVTPAAVVVNDNDGAAEDIFTVPATDGVEYLVDDKVIAAGIHPGLGTVTVKARASTDYVLAAGAAAEWSHAFKATPYQVTPAAVVFTDEDGTAGDTFTVAATEGVEYLVGEKVIVAGIHPGLGTVTVKARATTDYVLVAGAAAEWSHSFKATPFQVNPAAVVFSDKDGTAVDTFTVPTTQGVEYLVGDKVTSAGTYPAAGTVTVKARAIAGYVVAAGAAADWSHAFKATPYEVTPGAVVFTDKDGTAEDTYTVPAADGIEYLIGDVVKAAGTYPGLGTVTMTARAESDYVLPAGATAEWSHVFKATPYQVTPAAVVFTDKDGTAEDTFTVPVTEGVEYLVDDKVIAAGIHPGLGPVAVKARAITDYVLAAGAAAEWPYAFKATPYKVTPAAVVFNDNDGTAEDTFTVPATEGIDYLVGDAVKAAGTYPGSGTVTVKAHAVADYVLTAGATAEWSHAFKATPYKVTPAAVVFNDNDGTAEDTFTVPATEGIEYLVGDAVKAAGTYPGSGTVTVKARAVTDYVLAAGATVEWSHAFKATPYEVTPAAVVFTDKDGTAEDTFTVPSKEGVEYLVGDKVTAAGTYPGLGTVTVKARATTEHVFAEGATAEWTHAFKATPYQVTPAAVVFSDKDGTAEDMFTVPAMEGIEYLVGETVTAAGTYPGSGTVTVKARATTDHVLAPGATSEWTHAFKATPYTAVPAAVVFTDKDGTAEDTYTVPATEGVEYLAGDKVIAAGSYPGSGTVTVKARATADYVLAAGAATEWSHSFSAKHPAVPGSMMPVTPFRALDTRNGAMVAADSTVSFQVAGVGGVPKGVSAVVFNMTVAEAKSYGFVTAYASGSQRPDASNLNFDAGQIVANSVTVPVGTDGKVTLFNRSAGATHLLADVSGYYLPGTPTAAGAFASMAPTRFLDTRNSAAVSPDGEVSFQMAGVNGIPSKVSAVVLNLTVAEARSFGFITAYPSRAARPNASNVNFDKGQIIPNAVTVPVGEDGKVTLFNRSAGATHLLADVAGYYLAGTPTAAGTFKAVAPTRFLDTRDSVPARADGSVSFQVGGAYGVAADASAVVFNLTVADARSFGFITAHASGTDRPNASNVNFDARQIVPNLVTVPVGSDGRVNLFNRSSGATHLLADVSGYFLAG